MRYLFLLFFYSGVLCANDSLPWLHAEGSRIVDEQGQPVVLRGINMGAWLAEELWMLPVEKTAPARSAIPEIQDRAALWQLLETRFGKEGMMEIRHAFRCHWIRESDFRRIREAGINCIRLPFLVDLAEEPRGLFEWLDYAVEMANRYKIYLILDMHGAPGRQSDKQHSGEVGKALFFKDPAMVQRAALLWEKIAARYKNRSIIAGFDLLNEPMGAPNNSTLHLVYDQLYRAVRAEDTKHMLFIEDGFKGLDHMPIPEIVGWKNVVFSAHIYARSATTETEVLKHFQDLLNFYKTVQISHKVPIYVGEFNVHPHGSSKTIQSIITNFQLENVSWSIWAYKVGKKVGKNSTWGLYRCPKKMEKIDPFRDSKKEILKKIQQLKTENFDENRELLRVMQGA